MLVRFVFERLLVVELIVWKVGLDGVKRVMFWREEVLEERWVVVRVLIREVRFMLDRV